MSISIITKGDSVKVISGRNVPVGTIGEVREIKGGKFGEYFEILEALEGSACKLWKVSRSNVVKVDHGKEDPSPLTGLIDCEEGRVIIKPSSLAVSEDPRFLKAVVALQAEREEFTWFVPAKQFQEAERLLSSFRQSEVFQYRKAIYYQRIQEINRQRMHKEARYYEELLESLGGLDQPFGVLDSGAPRFPFEYQKEGISWLLRVASCMETKGGILADDMGLGKTMQAIAAGLAYMKKFRAMLRITCPASCKSGWQKEIKKQGLMEWNGGLFGDAEIMTYSKIAPYKSDRPFILIADESQNFSNPKSQRTQAFIKESQHPLCLAVWHLTGTPFRNAKPINVWAMLHTIGHPVAKDPNPETFTKQFKANDASMLRLNEQTAPVYLRRLKSECLELPRITRIEKRIELSEDGRKVYRETFKRLQEKSPHARMGIVRAIHMRQAASIARLEFTSDIGRQLIEQQQYPIFFVAFVDTAKQLAKELGPGARIYIGEMDSIERDAVREKFIAGKIDALVITYGAGGTGVDGFQHRSSTCVMHDLPLVPIEIFQAEGRLDRTGQVSPVMAYWVCSDLTIDIKQHELIKRKHDRSEKGLTGEGASIEFQSDISIEAELAKAVEGLLE